MQYKVVRKFSACFKKKNTDLKLQETTTKPKKKKDVGTMYWQHGTRHDQEKIINSETPVLVWKHDWEKWNYATKEKKL